MASRAGLDPVAMWLEGFGGHPPSTLKAVGLTRHRSAPALLVILGDRDSGDWGDDGGLRALSALELPSSPGLNLVLREIPGELRATAYLPAAQQEALTPEQEVLEPVVLGAQVQNGSADERLDGYGVGTLGRLPWTPRDERFCSATTTSSPPRTPG